MGPLWTSCSEEESSGDRWSFPRKHEPQEVKCIFRCALHLLSNTHTSLQGSRPPAQMWTAYCLYSQGSLRIAVWMAAETDISGVLASGSPRAETPSLKLSPLGGSSAAFYSEHPTLDDSGHRGLDLDPTCATMVRVSPWHAHKFQAG